MQVNIQPIYGNWDLGYSLDKHTISSTPVGSNQSGHMQFNTIRTEVGEALYQLKYRNNFSQVSIIANQMYYSFWSYFKTVNLIVPMPSSKSRVKQPVTEIAKALSQLMKIPCYETLLLKSIVTPVMKNISTKAEKIKNAFIVNKELNNNYLYDVLVIDDLYDTGSSLEVVTKVLKQYDRIRKVYVATVTRRR